MDSETLRVQSEPVATFDRSHLDDQVPHIHLLANEEMVSMITAAGSGYLDWDGIAVTRWQADRTRDADGYHLYLRDLDSGKYWSAGYQPTCIEPEKYQSRFYPGVAEFHRRDHNTSTKLEVCLAPDANVELRRCTITNHSANTRRIEITSYAELVLQHAHADAAHPAFSKLFVQTSFQSDIEAIFAYRRQRSDDDRSIAACHFSTSDDCELGTQHETDRSRFIGRGLDTARPAAMNSPGPLSGTTGSVLDPVASLRRVFILPAGASACVTFFVAVAEHGSQLKSYVQNYSRSQAIDETFSAAKNFAQQQIAEAGLNEDEFIQVLKLGGALLYGTSTKSGSLNDAGDRELLADCGLPGELIHNLPLLARSVSENRDLESVSVLLRACAYLKKHRLPCTIALLNQSPFRDDLFELINGQQHALEVGDGARQSERVVVLEAMDLSDEQYQQIQDLSRVSANGDLLSGFDTILRETISQDAEAEIRTFHPAERDETVGCAASEPLLFDNGFGGFSRDGTEYVLRIGQEDELSNTLPPMPWTNIVSNESAGFLITEIGAGYTWVGNSRENRLTPWYNDPIIDPHGEAVYIRDEDAQCYWSPTPGPVGQHGAYEVRHGFGYTKFLHQSHDLTQEVVKFVPRDAPMTITRVKLTNTSDRPRKLTLYSYLTWELSAGGPRDLQQVQTRIDHSLRTVFAVNHCPGDFSGHAAFASVVLSSRSSDHSQTADRTEFLGRHGNLSQPQAVTKGESLSGRSGSEFDPCAASRDSVKLGPGETLEYAVLVGQCQSAEDSTALIHQFSDFDRLDQVFAESRQYWHDLLSRVQINTPVPEIDVIVNGWLTYQSVSCRLWGRSAYYQAGGAFGFRDQLQDSAALVYHDPEITRRQILLHAAHQFQEGDVLHWWHPPHSRGIRTRFSDDLIWLPLIAAEYVETTGDLSLWEESVQFLTADEVPEREAEMLTSPQDSGETGSVYEHCCRSLDRSLTRGDHGLPLIGCGDWNDGMNRIGKAGLGESVWLGFFLDYAIGKMLPICESFGDSQRFKQYSEYREDLRSALQNAGWDGNWYRRAYFDDGTPVGTVEADECRIDALVQAWSIMSGVAPTHRARSAVAAVEERLVDDNAGMIRLLYPPFDKMDADPGYIKGYLPGVRENGGQYTHGVLWFVRAMAELGYCTRAVQLLSMLSPVSHGRTPEEVSTYKTEPYVVAADVYSEEPHVGRGGWTWYTGSAGWMFRIVIESLLGMGIEGGKTLKLDPHIDSSWREYSIHYRLPDGQTRYEIRVFNPNGKETAVTSATLDGNDVVVESGAARIPLLRDGKPHQVEINL